MKKYNRSKEELEKLIEKVNKDFPRHYRRIEEITIEVVLTPEEAIKIAKRYHRENELDGTVNEQIDSLLFDEAYTFKVDKGNRGNADIRPAWRVTVDIQANPYLFEDYTIIVSDRDKKVMGMLDVNGHPVSNGDEFNDEEIEYIMNDELGKSD